MNLAELAAQFAELKAQESELADRRRVIAALIQTATGHTGEGSKTYTDGAWKVTVKAPMNTSMNWDLWETVKADIPEDLWPIDMKPVLSGPGVKWLQDNAPDIFLKLSACLTTKPAALAVTVACKES